MRGWRRSFLLAFLCALCVLCVEPASAHPVPRDNHDRTIVVRLTPEAVHVDYRLEVDETRAALDLPRSELDRVSRPAELYSAFQRHLVAEVPDRLVARLNDKPLAFTCVGKRFELKDHLRYDLHFRAPWAPVAGKDNTFSFREGNYDEDDFSLVNLFLTADDDFTLRQTTVPSLALRTRSPLERRPGDGERLRRASVVFVLGPAKASTVPGPTPEASGPEPEQPGDEAVAAGPRKLLHLLFDGRHGIWVLLAMAAGLGAVHALTPGHGKTLVAAYLVGERGTIWHALLLGLVTTLTHTAAVLLLAALLPVFFPHHIPASVQVVLGLVGGLLVAGLGFWLFVCRVFGRADHVHLGGGHHHHHHEPVVKEGNARPGLWGLVVLGVSGGIVPCWDAIALLVVAIAKQRLWLGLPLLLAFSAGLAAVLIAIGIGVVCARNVADARWGRTERLAPLLKALPLISAVVVMLLGLWLCYDSIQAGHHPPPVQRAAVYLPASKVTSSRTIF